mgnify:FL=1
MRVLITGGSGQLGYDIAKLLEENNTMMYVPTHEEMDITDRDSVMMAFDSFKPDVVFHCAAYTAVDKAEEDKERCYDINVNGTKNIVDASNMYGSKVVYISTDYVFHGDKNGIYETSDITDPINYYGYTKYLGEQEVMKNSNNLVVRISWVFGINGKNFVKTMLRLASSRDEISVVSDQVGSPTYTYDLARLLVDMVNKNKSGIYQATNEGYCSWYEFAKYIFEVSGIDIRVNPILTKDYVTLAKRPLNSRLSKDKLDEDGLTRLPDWKDATKRYIRVLRKEK